MEIQIEYASVKVMRSHDYCHFEVSLSSSLAMTPEAVDELRKTAARLADKAVDQYKVAKLNAEMMCDDARRLSMLKDRAGFAQRTPESERTPSELAAIKALADHHHNSRPRYDYQDDWEEPDYTDDEDQY